MRRFTLLLGRIALLWSPVASRGFPALQAPLGLSAHTVQVLLSDGNWTEPPSADESGNMIFDSVSSLLQHWPNTLYRNGTLTLRGIQ